MKWNRNQISLEKQFIMFFYSKHLFFMMNHSPRDFNLSLHLIADLVEVHSRYHQLPPMPQVLPQLSPMPRSGWLSFIVWSWILMSRLIFSSGPSALMSCVNWTSIFFNNSWLFPPGKEKKMKEFLLKNSSSTILFSFYQLYFCHEHVCDDWNCLSSKLLCQNRLV